jgi:NADPH-dependent 2,4-dienoyl-CoA reductase/sulfur reductase-like enzyme
MTKFSADANKKPKDIVIIGGVAAGTSAASKAKRINPDANVTIIQQESTVSYGSCGLPYVLEGLIDDFSELIARTADEFQSKYGISILLNTSALKILPSEKQIIVSDFVSKNKEANKIIGYDSLVIATGANAIIPALQGIENINNGMFTLRTLNDGIAIKSFLENNSPNSCVVVGAGLIGVEIVEAFKKQGLEVTLVGSGNSILPKIIDTDISLIVKQELENNGIKIILGERVEKFLGDQKFQGVVTNKGKTILSDFLVLGTGVKPNSEIASDAGIKLGISNAIKVDKYMQTNISNIFAAGDCATAENYVTGKDTYLPLGTTANKQGRVAGENSAGGQAIFRGIAGSAITKTFDLFIGKTGLSTEEARKNGFDPIETDINSITRAGYYPDSKSILIKILADKKTQQILGAQIIGGEGVKGRIDVVALALLKKATINDLWSYDACYVPPISPVWEPLNIVASNLSKFV